MSVLDLPAAADVSATTARALGLRTDIFRLDLVRLSLAMNNVRSDVEDSINERLEESGIGDFLNRN